MKYTPRLYARALTAVIAKRMSPAEEKKTIRNFLELLRKNGDLRLAEKIVSEAERLTLERSGKRKVVLETARPLSDKQKKLLHKMLKPGDIVEEKTSPELVAGAKITVNGNLQFDGTLARKLKKMFGE